MAGRTPLWHNNCVIPQSNRLATPTWLNHGDTCWQLIAAISYLIKLFIPLRMSDEMLRIGDHAVHGEEAYGLAEEEDADELVPA